MSVDDVCSAEISRVPSLVEGRKTVQEAWVGRGNRVLKSVSKAASVLHAQRGSDPKDLDGMSVRALSTPAMCRGVRGELWRIWSRRARTRTRFIATRECLEARRWTQWTVGVLSLIRATCLLWRGGQTASITSQRSRRPAISRSELVSVPSGFVTDTMFWRIDGGHLKRKTVGGTAMFSPMTIPPHPWPDASVMPTKSGQAGRRVWHDVGRLADSWRKQRQSRIVWCRSALECRKTCLGFVARME